MSERIAKNNLTFKGVIIKALSAVLFLFLISTALSFLLAILLNTTKSPEMIYPYSGYIIISIAAYLTSKLYLKRAVNGNMSVIALTSLLAIAIITLVSVAANNGKTEIIHLLIKFALMFLLMLISSLSPNKKKSKRKSVKRR